MTQQEVIFVKNYIKGAYPNIKDDTTSDAVWYDLLKSEEYYGILQSVKNYIRSGNKYAPTLSEIIAGYELIVLEYQNEIIQRMDKDGYFNDGETSPYEIASWNKKNRMRKANVWASRDYPKEKIPDWFKRDYQRYEDLFKQKYFGETKVGMIE